MRGHRNIPMNQTLIVEKRILEAMSTVFSSNPQEDGYLLGCSLRTNHLTHALHLPAAHAGRNHYAPDPLRATEIIQHWATQGICFCGFIHSHVTDKQDLSEADLQFAQALFQAYRIPVLWFGLAVVSRNTVTFRFYSVTEDRETIHISPVVYTENSLRENVHESLHC